MNHSLNASLIMIIQQGYNSIEPDTNLPTIVPSDLICDGVLSKSIVSFPVSS